MHKNVLQEPTGGPQRFIGYRSSPPPEYFEHGAANPADEPQFEGVVFSDGSVAIRWLTEFRSHSIWPDYESFYKIHGHPEYGTIIRWLDPPLALSGMNV
jgi:hypothetical protein